MLTDQQILEANKEVVYAVRNEAGKVTGYTRSKPEGDFEARYEDDPEVVAYKARVDALLSAPAEPTAEQKLARAGLTVEELRALLGLPPASP